MTSKSSEQPSSTPHQRRPRYPGKNPRRFDQKYKELNPDQHPETIAKVIASGKTPAGMHVPIMVDPILEILHPESGERGVDCTLGYGGHAQRILEKLQPSGMLLGLDIDPIEQPRTEARLRSLGFSESSFIARRSNFAGLQRVLAEIQWDKADFILADLGVSSMQIDRPERGFSVKQDGPLDMRMNPGRGITAAQLIQKSTPDQLRLILIQNADEPHAETLARALAGHIFSTTIDLVFAIRSVIPPHPKDEADLCVRRVFQALRITVNEEFSALDTWLRILPSCLTAGGRVAVLTFHSGEDRRVKKAFQQYHRTGIFGEISDTVIRATPEECHTNPRATSAKLRWAILK